MIKNRKFIYLFFVVLNSFAITNVNADINSSIEVFRETQTPDRDRRLAIELFKSKYFFSSLAFTKNYIAGLNGY